jgi:hypothetical protein
MNSVFDYIGLAFFSLLCGICLGWLIAHDTVAMECNRLGGFYVGKTDFECKVKP